MCKTNKLDLLAQLVWRHLVHLGPLPHGGDEPLVLPVLEEPPWGLRQEAEGNQRGEEGRRHPNLFGDKIADKRI